MATSTGDVISIDPTAAYDSGAFVITGHASSPSSVASVAFQGFTDSGEVSLGSTAVGADGGFSFRVPILGRSVDDIDASETDGDGAVKSTGTGFSFDGNWTGQPFVASNEILTPIGARRETTYFRADGSIQGDVQYDTKDISNAVVLRRTNNDDGTNTTTVTESGATIQAAAFDTIANGSAPGNTFVFTPGDGLDVVKQFRGNGADHDTLSLKGSDFGDSFAEVLADTRQYRGVGTCITDPVSGDVVRIANISKAELAVNRGDVAFHA